MSDDIISDNNSTPQGIEIKTETIAKGALRIRTKLWIDHLGIDTASKLSVELYKTTCEKYRKEGFKIDGDP